MRDFLAGALLAALLAFPQPAAAANAAPALDAAAQAAIDRLFARQVHPDGPGCALQVARDGEAVLARGYGMANLQFSIPNGPDVVYPIGSNSKQFTAMAILLLAEEGKLSLDDDIRKFLPDFPVYGAPATPIRIRHLLFHTSGLRDYQALRFLAGVPPERLERAEILGLLRRQRGLNFPPGTKHSYSNAGYVLLGSIVEKITGKSLPDFAAERIFAPLGMTHTLWSERSDVVVPRGAALYMGDHDDGYQMKTAASLAGSGGIWTTTGDLLRWLDNWRHNRLGRGSAGLVAQELSRGALDDGTPIDYGFGLFHDVYRGKPILWHAGVGSGHVGDIVVFPQQNVSIVCLCNTHVDSRALTRQVADVVLGLQPPAASPAAAAGPVVAERFLDLAPAARERFAGRYRNPVSGTVFRFAAEADRVALYVGTMRIALRPVGADELRSVDPDLGWHLRFEPVGASAPQTVRLFQDGKQTAQYRRLPPPPTADVLRTYAGSYFSEELQATYTLAVEGDSLVLHTPVQPNGELEPLAPDAFVLSSPWFSVEFAFARQKGAPAVVSGFEVSTGEADHIAFRRLPDCASPPPASH
ncbi:MAG: serine hydrolase domain-containing protein [Acidobacteriota bacterium]